PRYALVLLFVHCHSTLTTVLSYALFFFNDTATTEIYTLSLHDALPISCGTKMVVSMIGSRISSIFDGSGSFAGFSIGVTDPSRSMTSYTTVGAVVTSDISYSRSSRSCTISMCSRPRNPQRKPQPSACEVSGS